MVRISDTKVRKPYKYKRVDFSDLNKLYSTGIAMNDIDIALRKRELQQTISSMLVDVSPAEPPQLDDDALMANFIGKEMEVPEIHAYLEGIQKGYYDSIHEVKQQTE